MSEHVLTRLLHPPTEDFWVAHQASITCTSSPGLSRAHFNWPQTPPGHGGKPVASDSWDHWDGNLHTTGQPETYINIHKP